LNISDDMIALRNSSLLKRRDRLSIRRTTSPPSQNQT